MKKNIKLLSIILILSCFTSCDEYLDVVPDNVATIDNAFTMRSEAIKYLFTCYSYLPREADPTANPGFLSGDEAWLYYPAYNIDERAWEIARGNQNKVSPYLNYWDGSDGGQPLFRALRDCNIFLENVDKVLDLDPFVKKRWVAEVKFLKAYYHFWLLRMYGPIPIIDKNLPISASVEEVKVERQPVDKIFEYIYSLINEAAPDLPVSIQDVGAELGRITQPIALAMKAKISVTAASPLFNGNTDYSGFTAKDGTPFFNPSKDPVKWDSAVVACRKAIEVSEAAGHQLFYFTNFLLDLSDSTKVKMNIRNSVTERWNAETIWGSANSRGNDLQRQAMPRIDPTRVVNQQTLGQYAPTLEMAELFYSENGIPISEDKTWNYSGRYDLQTAEEDHKYYIKEGYETVSLHFNREARFYANIGFDGGIWYGQGRNDDEDTWHVEAKMGQTASRREMQKYSITGYYTKKLVHWETTIGDEQEFNRVDYPWPVMRLADLYLLYAEALNEAKGPSQEVYNYLNLVRERAGLKGVEESWSQYSVNSSKYQNQDGLREIIHQERLIELAFEAKRFWDLRRWKKAQEEFNEPIRGFDIEQEEAAAFYRPKVLYDQKFSVRDYFWPISEGSIIVNRNFVQNPGW